MRVGHLIAVTVVLAGCRLEQVTPARPDSAAAARVVSDSLVARSFLHGLRTAKYAVGDLQAAKAWYRELLGKDPYFDEPFYVGFNVGGFELGLVPDDGEGPARKESSLAYWGGTRAAAFRVFGCKTCPGRLAGSLDRSANRRILGGYPNQDLPCVRLPCCSPPPSSSSPVGARVVMRTPPGR